MMGICLKPSSEMGEYSVEVRRESFYLRGDDSYNGDVHHALYLYPSPAGGNQGTVEILIEDILKIRAALDQVEAYLRSR